MRCNWSGAMPIPSSVTSIRTVITSSGEEEAAIELTAIVTGPPRG
jgi:hypothetical protein